MSNDVIDRFIESWGAMGAFWGVNTSVARVHALLIVSDRTWTLDEIAARLLISKGNASMCLKELRAWKVVRRETRPGDRREHYSSEPSSWAMLFTIARERKRREFDPLVESVRSTLAAARQHPAGVAVDRLAGMEEMLGTLERLTERALRSEEQARALIGFVLGMR
ncbi:MAG TPA: MarR family transcriptional regulator [Candidatus Methanoperedens sp.]|nr:MarR family transcriptional regulator [Candidatus Methanoperedens sp.]